MNLIITKRVRRTVVRSALAGVIIAGGLAAARATAPPASAQLASSPKSDWRGADLTNNGALGTTGPASPPSQTFNQKPSFGGVTTGIELDAAGNVVFFNTSGTLYSYTPAGVKNWSSAVGTSNNAAGSVSNPVVSSDGNIYVGADTGALYQVNAGTGAAAQAFSAAPNGLAMTPKIGPDNALYLGDTGGKFYRLTVSGSSATAAYTFNASGSTQTAGNNSGVTSAAPFSFYGEAALDAAGNALVASSDTNPNNPSGPHLGTLYSVSPAGSLNWKAPLEGEAVGAVALAPNPANPGHTLALVADKSPEVVAYDAASGALVWRFNPVQPDAIFASPAAANGVVYVPNSGNSLYALDAGTGALVSGFGTGGIRAVASGSQSSVVTDAAGSLYLMGGDGTLYSFTAAGALLWSIAGGTGPGQSGATSPKFMSPAIAGDGTLYVGGNSATVRGFRFDSVGATNTAAAQQTTAAAQTNAANTATAAANQTNVANTATTIAQQTQNANANNTATAAAQQTATAGANQTNTASTATAAAGQTNAAGTATAAAGQTNTANTATAAAGQTNTATTATAAAGQTATATAISGQQTAAAQTASAQQTAAAQTAAAGGAPNCQLIVLPNPETVQQGGSEAVLFKVRPNTTITTTINAGDTYPTTATLYMNAVRPGTLINGTNVGGQNYQFVFNGGNNGRALIDFPIPAGAPIGKWTVQTTIAPQGCDLKHPLNSTVKWNVEAAQASSFGNTVKLSLHHVVIRTPELPNHAGSVVNDKVKITTAPGSVVTTTAVISAPVGSLGTAVDGGTAFSNGQVFYSNTQTANAKGQVFVTLPISSTLLVPGKGGTIKVTVLSNTGGKSSAFKTSLPVREQRLRLIVQPKETTRGNKRVVFLLGHLKNGTSVFSVLAVADQNAHIAGTATFGSTVLNATGTAGTVGGRVTLKFNVPNGVAPSTSKIHFTGSVAVTSTYRSATITRTANFTYSTK